MGKSTLIRIVEANDEDASSGKRCRECQTEIEDGELVFGKLQYQYLSDLAAGRPARGGWRRFSCVEDRMIDEVIKNDGEVFNLEAVSGFETLSEHSKSQVRARFDQVASMQDEIKAERKAERDLLRQEEEETRQKQVAKREQMRKAARAAKKAEKTAAARQQQRGDWKEMRTAFKEQEQAARAKRTTAEPAEEKEAAAAAAESEVPEAEVSEGAAEGASPRKRRRKEKDPHAPRRPLSAYMLYANDAKVVEELKAKHPGVDHRTLTSRKGAEWKTLGELGQKPWVERAAAAMAAYTTELAAYKLTDNYKNWQSAQAAQTKPPPKKPRGASALTKKTKAAAKVRCCHAPGSGRWPLR
eukprot:COSAG01_NODE_4162_length_5279_cov_33.245560_4_plen_356_part_00